MINLIIINFFTLLIIHDIGFNLFIEAHSKILSFIIFIISWIFITLVNFNGVGNIATSLFLTIIYFLYVFLNFNGNTILKTFSVTFICLSLAISEFVSASFINLIEPLAEFSLSYIIALYLTIFLLFLESKAYIYISKLFLEQFSKKNFWSLLVLPFFTFTIILGINQNFDLFVKNKLFLVYLVFSVVGIYCSNFLMLNFYLKSLKSAKLEYKLELEKQVNKNLKSKFEYLNKYYLSKFSFLHNMLHSLNKLSILNKKRKYQELENELELLAQQTSKEFNLLYTNSKAIGTAINEKLEYIIKNEVKIYSKLENDLDFLSFQSQVLLFSELLTYCLNSSVQKGDTNPIIIFKSKKIGNIYLLKCNCNYELNNINFPIFQAKIKEISKMTDIHKVYDKTTDIDCLMITFYLSQNYESFK